MDKLVVCIILLSTTGCYQVNTNTDAMHDNGFKKLLLDEYYAMYIENENKTITLAKKEEDTSHHQTSNSITTDYNQIINIMSDNNQYNVR
jgi:hypothetical protein